MERFRWQRSKVAAQHALLLEFEAFIPALIFVFLINPICELKLNSTNYTGVVSQKALEAWKGEVSIVLHVLRNDNFAKGNKDARTIAI